MPTELPPSLAPADQAIIIGYFLVMVYIGVFYMRRMKNTHEFFGGGGQIPWWLSGVSFYMSAFSAFSFVAYSAIAYKYGFVAVTICWLTVPAVLIAALGFAVAWRRAARTSALEYIESRFGIALRQMLAWLTIPMRTIDDGLKLFAVGLIVSVGLDYPLHWAILGSGLIVLSYSFLGGLWAVMITDFVQGIIKLLAIVLLVPLALSRVDGLGGLVAGSPEGFFNLTTERFDVGFMLIFLVLISLNYSSSWGLVQRFFSVRTDADARKVGYTVAFLNFVIPPLMYLPAIAAVQFMPNVADSNDVFPLLCRELLPVGMVGVVIAAMFASTMAMLSSDYNSMAAVLTNDVYRRLVAPGASERHLIVIARLATFALGMVSIGIAVIIMRSGGKSDLFEMMVNLSSIFMAPIALPMIAGLTTRRVSNAGALLGMLLGIITGVALHFSGDPAVLARLQGWGWFTGTTPEQWGKLAGMQVVAVATIIVTSGGMLLGSLMRPGDAAQQVQIDEFFARLAAQPATPATTPQDVLAMRTSLRVIGFSSTALGSVIVIGVLLGVPLAEAALSLAAGVFMLLLGLAFWLAGRRPVAGLTPASQTHAPHADADATPERESTH